MSERALTRPRLQLQDSLSASGQHRQGAASRLEGDLRAAVPVQVPHRRSGRSPRALRNPKGNRPAGRERRAGGGEGELVGPGHLAAIQLLGAGDDQLRIPIIVEIRHRGSGELAGHRQGEGSRRISLSPEGLQESLPAVNEEWTFRGLGHHRRQQRIAPALNREAGEQRAAGREGVQLALRGGHHDLRPAIAVEIRQGRSGGDGLGKRGPAASARETAGPHPHREAGQRRPPLGDDVRLALGGGQHQLVPAVAVQIRELGRGETGSADAPPEAAHREGLEVNEDGLSCLRAHQAPRVAVADHHPNPQGDREGKGVLLGERRRHPQSAWIHLAQHATETPAALDLAQLLERALLRCQPARGLQRGLERRAGLDGGRDRNGRLAVEGGEPERLDQVHRGGDAKSQHFLHRLVGGEAALAELGRPAAGEGARGAGEELVQLSRGERRREVFLPGGAGHQPGHSRRQGSGPRGASARWRGERHVPAPSRAAVRLEEAARGRPARPLEGDRPREEGSLQVRRGVEPHGELLRARGYHRRATLVAEVDGPLQRLTRAHGPHQDHRHLRPLGCVGQRGRHPGGVGQGGSRHPQREQRAIRASAGPPDAVVGRSRHLERLQRAQRSTGSAVEGVVVVRQEVPATDVVHQAVLVAVLLVGEEGDQVLGIDEAVPVQVAPIRAGGQAGVHHLGGRGQLLVLGRGEVLGVEATIAVAVMRNRPRGEAAVSVLGRRQLAWRERPAVHQIALAPAHSGVEQGDHHPGVASGMRPGAVHPGAYSGGSLLCREPAGERSRSEAEEVPLLRVTRIVRPIGWIGIGLGG